MIAPRLDEASLEALIVTQMVEGGWSEGRPPDFDPAYALDLEHLTTFVEATQPRVAKALSLGDQTPDRHRFLARLQGEITSVGWWTSFGAVWITSASTWTSTTRNRA